MINRVKAQYKMCGPGVYNEDKLNPQTCFTCRSKIGDARMPPIFFSLLTLTQVCEMTSMAGLNKTARNQCLKDSIAKAKKAGHVVNLEPVAFYKGQKAEFRDFKIIGIYYVENDETILRPVLIDQDNIIYDMKTEQKTSINFNELEYKVDKYINDENGNIKIYVYKSQAEIETVEEDTEDIDVSEIYILNSEKERKLYYISDDNIIYDPETQEEVDFKYDELSRLKPAENTKDPKMLVEMYAFNKDIGLQ